MLSNLLYMHLVHIHCVLSTWEAHPSARGRSLLVRSSRELSSCPFRFSSMSHATLYAYRDRFGENGYSRWRSHWRLKVSFCSGFPFSLVSLHYMLLKGVISMRGTSVKTYNGQGQTLPHDLSLETSRYAKVSYFFLN